MLQTIAQPTVKELFLSLGLNIPKYANLYLSELESDDGSTIQPKQLFLTEELPSVVPEYGITRILRGAYATGEIWQCSTTKNIYLYLGKSKFNSAWDVVLILKGDPDDLGCIEEALTGATSGIYFDKRLFPL